MKGVGDWDVAKVFNEQGSNLATSPTIIVLKALSIAEVSFILALVTIGNNTNPECAEGVMLEKVINKMNLFQKNMRQTMYLTSHMKAVARRLCHFGLINITLEG